MNVYHQPERELSAEEKLLAVVVQLDQRIPFGYQLAMPLHLGRSITAVEELFTRHALRGKEEIIAELELWRTHAVDGVKLAQQCEGLMLTVLRTVGDTVDRQRR